MNYCRRRFNNNLHAKRTSNEMTNHMRCGLRYTCFDLAEKTQTCHNNSDQVSAE